MLLVSGDTRWRTTPHTIEKNSATSDHINSVTATINAAWDVLSDNPVDVSTQFSLAQHSIPDPQTNIPVVPLSRLVVCMLRTKLYTRDPMNMTTTIVDGTMTLTYWT
jgi:hypothetical protein